MAENTSLQTMTGANAPAAFMEEAMADTYISFSMDTPTAKMSAYNAINNPDAKVSDMINKTINLVDVVMIPVNLTSDETGESENAMRSILIDADGTTYTATATGIFNSLRNIYLIFGSLHFEEPLTVEVNQVATKRGNTLTLKLIDK